MPGEAERRRGDSAPTARTQVRRGKVPTGPPVAVQEKGHASELWGLACLGLAAFLVFVMLAGETAGGIIGGFAAGLLAVAFGRLAFLVPAALVLLAVSLVVRWRPQLSRAIVAGGALLLFSLFLLTAAGFPPFGSGHDLPEYVAGVYRGRSGWVGEVLFVLGRRLIGAVGVAILGWLALLGGVSLLTGWTIRRVAAGTGRAARAVGTAATERTRRLRAGRKAAVASPGPLDDPYLTGFGPEPSPAPVAEDDLFAELDFGPPGGLANPPLRIVSPPAVTPRRLRDAATDFPDLYQDTAEGLEVENGAGGGSVEPDEVPTLVRGPGEHDSACGAGHREPPLEGTDQALSGRPPEAGPADGAAGEKRETVTSGVGTGVVAGVTPAGMATGSEQEPATTTWLIPESDLLRKSKVSADAELKADDVTGARLVETLAYFGVDARVSGTVTGPRVTRYELQLAPGTKVSKVTNLKDDIAYALASTEIRILAPIPGKSAVGVEVPNQRPQYVTLGDIYRDFPPHAGPLMVWLGKDISGRAVYTDLAKMPHLLIAGTTGSGKSGCINCLISSVLLRSTPDQVRMVLIDPKKVELSHYERIPHLLVPVVTHMKNAAGVLNNLVREMDERYTLMEMVKARSLEEMNRIRVRKGDLPLPFLLIVIDELADLMMVSPAEVEEYVIRIAQKARAVGIHLVVATQRPSADVITGMIKANIPSRIAFAVSSQTDSRVILDVNGAEALLGSGDMLFRPLGSSKLQRIQGAFITEEEIQVLVTNWRRQAEPAFREELLMSPAEAMAEEAIFDPDSDEMLADAAELVLDTGTASVSMLQRRLRVGYTRAGRLIDMLERRGIVGPYEGSKPRQMLVPPSEREETLEALRAEMKGGDPVQLSLADEPPGSELE